MAADWYYRTPTGRAEGPMTGVRLKQLVQLGEIGPRTEIRKGAGGRWVTANRVGGLLPAAPMRPTVAKDKSSKGQQPVDDGDAAEPPESRPKSQAPVVRRSQEDAQSDKVDRSLPEPRTTSALADVESTLKNPGGQWSPLLLAGAGFGGLLAVSIVLAVMLPSQPGEHRSMAESSELSDQSRQVQLAEEQRRRAEQERAAMEKREFLAKRERELIAQREWVRVANVEAEEIKRQKHEAWLTSGREIGQFMGTEDSWFAGYGTTKGIAISPHNKYVAAVSNSKSVGSVFSAVDSVKGFGDTAIYLWNMKESVQLYRFDPTPHMRPVTHNWTSVAFSGDERLVAAGREDGTIRVWDTATGQEVAVLLTPSDSYDSFGSVESISFSQDGSTIVGAGTGAGGNPAYPVWVWSVAAKKIINVLNGHSDIVVASDLSKDGRFAVTGSWDRTAIIWDLLSGREHRLLDAHSEKVTAVAFSADGGQVLTGSHDQTVRLWDVSSGRQIFSLDVGNAVRSVSYRAGGKYALVGTSMRPDAYLASAVDSNPVLVDLNKRTVAKLPAAFRKKLSEDVYAAVSSDGRFVVFTAKQHTRVRGRDVEASYLTLRELPE